MINVLVVDDSAYSRRVITRILESIPDVHVIDTARDGQDALRKAQRLKPDLITLDLEMPEMDGFTLLRWIMANMPTPVIVVSAQEADASVFRALDLGAIDFVLKPTRHASVRLEEIHADLLEKVLATPLLHMKKLKERMKHETHVSKTVVIEESPAAERPSVIAIASSTGGPPAIQAIISNLPDSFRIPILIAQHMPANFTRLFAERLNRYSGRNVVEATDGRPVEPNTVYIAPGGHHVVVDRLGGKIVTHVLEREADRRYSPSGNLLFNSVSEIFGARSIGAVLTGMGDDGRDGLKRIKEAHGTTIAESEKTAIIFGMPQEAINAGIVDYVLALDDIPDHLVALCKED